jgi:tRNA-modifying protein YgfZ
MPEGVADSRAVRVDMDRDAGYDALRRSVAVVHRADLVQLRMWGRDPRRMLNGLITNDLGLLSAERCVYGAMLTPKGKIISDLRAMVWRIAGQSLGSDETGAPLGSSELLIDLPRAAQARVEEHLKKYVPPLFARWSEAGTGVIGLYGPRAGVIVRSRLGAEPPTAEDQSVIAHLGDQRILLVGTRFATSEIGFDIVVPSDAIDETLTTLITWAEADGGSAIGSDTLNIGRIERGRPRYGAELTEEILPGEVFESTGQMERAVSFGKGCYTGQEVVVRIAHRGHVNRTLRGLLLGELPSPPAGTALFDSSGNKQVGWVTSVANSPRMRQTIGLGYVRREVSPGDSVRVGDVGMAVVSELPF